MLAESTTEPANLYLDKVDDGKARILARWNINAVTREEGIFYQYEEKVIIWQLPLTYQNGETNVTISAFSDAEAYITANTEEILNFAKGSTKTFRRS